jgi:hypothetical protein
MLQEIPLLLSKENIAKHNYKLPADATLSIHSGEYIDNMNIPISPMEGFLSGDFFLSGEDDKKSFLEKTSPFFLQESLPCYQKALSLDELSRAHVTSSAETSPIVKGKRKYKKYQPNKTMRIGYQKPCGQNPLKKRKEFEQNKENFDMLIQEIYKQHHYDPERERNNQYNIIGTDRTPSPSVKELGSGLCQKGTTCINATYPPSLTPVNMKKMSLFDAVPLLLQGC